MWKCVRDMQFGRRGRVPTTVVAICDESGEPCSTPTEQHQRWRRPFTKLLNVRTQFDGAELAEVRQRETDADLGTVPTSAEVAKVLGKLKNGKASGSSNILPEMLKVGSRVVEFTGMIADLVHRIWEERRVPKEWVDAILIPIPKKGNLRSCDNWCGISLQGSRRLPESFKADCKSQQRENCRSLSEALGKDVAVWTCFSLSGSSRRKLLNIKLSSSSSLLI